MSDYKPLSEDEEREWRCIARFTGDTHDERLFATLDAERKRREAAERVIKQIAELPVGQYEGPYGEACDCPECVGVRATARDMETL